MNSNIIAKNPFFSIITVVKNDEKNIDKTITSILEQKFKNFEYIVVDGDSKDSTLSIVNKYKKNINHVISEPDDGIYFAMNKGARISKGEFVVYVNSGDVLKVNALQKVYDIITQNNNIDFVFGTVIRHYTKNTFLKSGFDRKKLKFNFDFATSHSTGFFLRKKIFSKLNFFNTKYKCSADYDLYYKILIKKGLHGTSTDKSEIIGEVSAGGFSSKLSFIEHLIEEIQIRYDNGQNLFILLLIILNSLIKHLKKTLFR